MALDTTTLDAPFAALTAYDFGADSSFVKTIDDAVIAAHGDATLTADLEKRFLALLGPGTKRAAKEYVCRKLSMIGTPAAVPALAALLGDKDNSHMARFALERIPGPESVAAIRGALGKVQGDLVIGMLSSLANRRDAESVPLVAPLLAGDAKVAVAAAAALGRIATPAAAAALAAAQPAAGPVADAVVDARLAAADALLAAGDRTTARGIYEAIAAQVGDAAGTRRQRAVRIAARGGVFAALDGTVAP